MNYSAIACLFVGLLVTAGCSSDYLNEVYGMRTSYGANSVNGTTVLGDMFVSAGHDVRSWRVMSPSLAEADVIVWFQQDFGAPSPEAQDWLYDWLLYNDEAKTLIYVSRDYEAGPLYWRTAKPLAPTGQQAEFSLRERESESAFSSQRGSAPAGYECNSWFTLDRRNAKTTVKGLGGSWAAGIDPTKVEIEHRRFLTPNAEEADMLLADSAGHPLVSEIVYIPSETGWGAEDSRLIMIENGAFLLNAALVNKEHRKLAGKLVEHVGSPELDIVFLESGAEPRIMDDDPSTGPPSGFQLFRIWPIGAVLAQLAALGLVFAMARFPIFGVPRRLEEPALTDFGRHVSALGRLLAATRDRAYAYAQLRSYFQISSDDTNPPPSTPSKSITPQQTHE